MNKNYLLPHRFKTAGIIMFFPFCAACLWLLLSGVLDCSYITHKRNRNARIAGLPLLYRAVQREG